MNGSAIPAAFAARLRRAEPMARHTSWRAGGPAEYWFEPQDADDLAAFLRTLPAPVPVTFVGLGSNLLVRDGGIDGVVISLHGILAGLERVGALQVRAGAGLPCARFARRCLQWQLGPVEFFGGIPGTIGGALAMNAGAWGGETWPLVAEVEVIDRSGTRRWRPASDYRWGYRSVTAPVAGEWFLAALFTLQAQPDADPGRINALLEERRRTQPVNERSCGSVFRNPPGDHAARLIEAAGLKGQRIGGALVSPRHANFIVNDGTATAADLEALLRRVQAVVQQVHGVHLEPEVRIIGRAA